MKQLDSTTRNGVLVFLIFAAFMINGVATYFQNTLIPNATKIIGIIVLLTVYFMVRHKMANVFYTIILFWFLGDAFAAFNLGEFSGKLSTTFYLGSYSLLIFVLLGKLKRIHYEGLVSVYLILVLLLNAYFLYILCGVMKETFSDNLNLIVSISHGIALLAMAYFAFAVYLSQETTQSIIFLVMVFCIVFSDVLMYICNLYVYFWLFEFMGNMLHIASFAMLFTYVYNHHNKIKVKRKESFTDFSLLHSERLTA